MGELLCQGLEEQKHNVTLARDGSEGFHAAASTPFDAIVLDVMLRGMDGFEVARRLRAEGNTTPILLLTARDSDADVIRGLDAGADDYLTKPFSFNVLLARLRALSRRSARPPVRTLEAGDLTLDAPSVKALHWALPKIWAKAPMPPAFEIRHEGKCGRCGRALTVPESVDTGFGPECSSALGIDWQKHPAPVSEAPKGGLFDEAFEEAR